MDEESNLSTCCRTIRREKVSAHASVLCEVSGRFLSLFLDRTEYQIAQRVLGYNRTESSSAVGSPFLYFGRLSRKVEVNQYLNMTMIV
jgi:hypothetical protein